MLSKNRFHALSDLNCDLEISTHMTPEHPSLPAAAGIADFKASKGLVVGPPVGGTETVLEIANRATPPSSPDEGEKKLDNGSNIVHSQDLPETITIFKRRPD